MSRRSADIALWTTLRRALLMAARGIEVYVEQRLNNRFDNEEETPV
jgi:hypothetical protein